MTTPVRADERNAGPLDKQGVFSILRGFPIFWNGRVFRHSVQGADAHPGVRLLWTRCGIDVPADTAFLDGFETEVTCPKCAKILEP
jgi:hypothetical protein